MSPNSLTIVANLARLTTSQRALLYICHAVFWALVQRRKATARESACWRTPRSDSSIAGGAHGGAVADLAPELEGFCPEIDKFGALARALRGS